MKKIYQIEKFTKVNVILIDNKIAFASDQNFFQIPSSIGVVCQKGAIIFSSAKELKNEFTVFLKSIETFLKLKENKVFSKRLKITGLGYKFFKEENSLIAILGHSKPIKLSVPHSISNIIIKKNLIVLESSENVVLGDFVKKLCSLKKKDIYKGKGLLPEYKNLKLKEIKKK